MRINRNILRRFMYGYVWQATELNASKTTSGNKESGTNFTS